jgi:virginiamycin B lyase
MRRLALLLLTTTAGAALLVGCGRGSATDVAPPSVINLPPGSEPERLLRTADGSLWATETDGSELARVLPGGTVRYYHLPELESGIAYLAEGPEGAVWLTGGGEVFSVQPESGAVALDKGSGSSGNPEIGFTGALIAGPEGALWYTSEGRPDRIVRITAGGNVTGFTLGGSAEEEMDGIAYGADGALWFTLASSGLEGDPGDAIGRLEADGNFTRRPLPDKQGHPSRIVAGPDGDLWFSEEVGDRIGRLSPGGQIKEFTLPPGVSPTGLTVSGGQVWFSSAHKVGRVARDGQISEWRIAGAVEITDIAPDPPAGVWLADGGAGVLRRFSPGGS